MTATETRREAAHDAPLKVGLVIDGAEVAGANDTGYGLCASVWSGDEDLTDRVTSQLEAGTVFVNQHGMQAIDHRAPMGGWKRSGYGMELGVEGMLAFTRTRVVLAAPSK